MNTIPGPDGQAPRPGRAGRLEQSRRALSTGLQAAALCTALLSFAGTASATGRGPHGHGFPSGHPIPAFVELFLEKRNVSLPFPSPGESQFRKSLRFALVGNIPVSMRAEPDVRITIDGRELGRANRGGEAVGYDIALKFGWKHGWKRSEFVASGPGATLPSSVLMNGVDEARYWHSASGAAGDFLENSLLGELVVTTDSAWAANGGLPLPGDYDGQVTITLTPDF